MYLDQAKPVNMLGKVYPIGLAKIFVEIKRVHHWAPRDSRTSMLV